VYAELRSQSMAIMDYLVATAQDDVHAPIESMRYCVVHLTPPVLMQLESHIRSVAVINFKNLKFTLNVRTPLSHLENCKHYFYMILLQ